MIKKGKTTFLLLFSMLIILIFLFGGVALAQENNESGETEGGVELGAPIGGEDEPSNFADYVNTIYDFAVVAGTSLAVLVIIFAGYKYMASSGDPQSTAEAKELLVGAIVGLVLILLTRLILVSIDPRILEIPSRNPLLDVERAGPSGSDVSPSPTISPEET